MKKVLRIEILLCICMLVMTTNVMTHSFKYSQIGEKTLSSNTSTGIMSDNIFISQNANKETPACYNEKEFWGVVIVNVNQVIKPYIYDSLLTSKNWDKNHLQLLWKENATRDAIMDSISWLESNADDNDIVFFAGDIHGTYNGNNFGIWPWDGSSAGIITVEELDEKINRINASAICLIFDSCLSGNFVEKLKSENRIVIVSSMKDGLAGHCYDLGFTTEYSLTSFLGEAFTKKIDDNGDGWCSAEEAFEYAKIKWRPFAMKSFINVPVQMFVLMRYGFLFKPFPSITDLFVGELPIVTK